MRSGSGRRAGRDAEGPLADTAPGRLPPLGSCGYRFGGLGEGRCQDLVLTGDREGSFIVGTHLNNGVKSETARAVNSGGFKYPLGW
jgi:hypothetical protein